MFRNPVRRRAVLPVNKPSKRGMLVLTLDKATKKDLLQYCFSRIDQKRTSDHIDTMNNNKITNEIDVEATGTTASMKYFLAKRHHTESPVLDPTSRSKSARYTRPSA